MIASRSGDPLRNRLETGTLGFSDIHNSLHSSVEQAGASFGHGMTVTQQALSGATSAVTAGLGHNAADHSTTHAAVSPGAIILRDPTHQTQNIAALSQDVDHAANALTPQFDKAKEQQRLQTLQAAQGVVDQASTIGTTYGDLHARKAVRDDPTASAQVNQQADALVAAQINAGTLNPHDAQAVSTARGQAREQSLTQSQRYRDTMRQYGIGSGVNSAIDSGAHLLAGVLAGNNQGALASAAAPYLAQGVKAITTGNQPSEALTPSQLTLNALGHAVAGGAVAQVSGTNAAAGAASAAAGELAAHAAASLIANGTPTHDLTQEQREQISQWGQLAGGIAGVLAGNGHNLAAEAGTGAQAGKNAVTHNLLSNKYGLAELKANHDEKGLALYEKLAAAGIGTVDDLQEKFEACNGNSACQIDIRERYDKRAQDAEKKLLSLYSAGQLTTDEFNNLYYNYANTMIRGAAQGQRESGRSGAYRDIYGISGLDWAGRTYLKPVVNSERLARWQAQGASKDEIQTGITQNNLIDSLFSPDINAFNAHVLDKGVSAGEAIDVGLMGVFLSAAHTPLGAIGKTSPTAISNGTNNNSNLGLPYHDAEQANPIKQVKAHSEPTESISKSDSAGSLPEATRADVSATPDTTSTKLLSSYNFESQEKLENHFVKHGNEFDSINKDDYLDVGRDIIKDGYKIQYEYKGEVRTGYLHYMGNRNSLKGGADRGASKFGFVGTNSSVDITTIHIKSGKELWKMLNNNSLDKTIRPLYDE